MKTKTYKVTIVQSRLNNQPIVNYCFGDSKQEAINKVCNWHSVTPNDSQTIVKAEENKSPVGG